MLLKKYVKNRRKIKVLLLLMVLGLIVVTLIVLNAGRSGPLNMHSAQVERQQQQVRSILARASKLEQQQQQQAPAPLLLKSPLENGVIVLEKYDEHKIKERIMQDKLQLLKERRGALNAAEDDEEHTVLETVTNAVHIYYHAPVQWYKTKKVPPQPQSQSQSQSLLGERALGDDSAGNSNSNSSGSYAAPPPTTHRPAVRILNTAFYPALGLYKPNDNLLQKHFENIRNCGVGVLILSYTGKPGEGELHRRILELVPKYNLSVTFEISVAANQSVDYVQQQLLALRRYSGSASFYRVYSLAQHKLLPVVYVSNAYKLLETGGGRVFCRSNPDNLRHSLDAYFIGHIRLKGHAETMRRLCFDGLYSKLPSNGATFASTWKNWSYLKSFALTYKMLFVPTVGPGFAERNKFPRHGDIQRHRSNGRYYGVAWRTAILNHVGFISIASYNNWPDGSQIEEVIPKAGFLDYNPGAKTKYLDLTTHWVGNFLKTRNEAAIGGGQTCYEFVNNTIC